MCVGDVYVGGGGGVYLTHPILDTPSPPPTYTPHTHVIIHSLNSCSPPYTFFVQLSLAAL